MPTRRCLLLLPALFACAPVVTHGPRVEPGAALTMTVGAPRPFCGSNTDTECNAGLIPTWGVGARYGFTSRSASAPAAQVGLSLPIADPLGSELDAFVQAPSAGSWAAGAGALWSARHLMPYAQVGQMAEDGGPGWYVTAAYAHLYRDPSVAVDQTDEDGDVMVRPPRYWAPGAAFRTRRGGAGYTFFVQGAFGSYVKRETVYDGSGGAPRVVDSRKPVRTVLFGVVWDVSFRDIYFPWSRSRPVPPPLPPRDAVPPAVPPP